MNYKNPNLNLPTKNESDRKSPLKLRPNFQGPLSINMNSNRSYSNTIPPPLKSPVEMAQSPQQDNYFNFQQSPVQQPMQQSNANPLKTTFNYQSGQQVQQPPQTYPTNNGYQNPSPLQSKSFAPTAPVYNPTLTNGHGQSFNGNQNGQATLQHQTSIKMAPNGNQFETAQKESNLSGYSRTNTVNDPSRFQSNTMANTRPSEMNDNLSYHSRISTNSRNHVLRAISVNNEDHLYNLSNKEDTLKNQNILIVNNFLQSVESSKRNVLRNMTENFKSRIHEIWNSYLMEQMKSNPPTIDINSLNGDVEMIKKVFLDYLLVKTEAYVEDLKLQFLMTIFKEVDDANNQKQYLDVEVKNIVENRYNPVKGKNTELREKLTETRNAYKGLIDQTIQKYEKLRETHMDMYDREFAFKLNGDQNLVKNTLKHGLAFLHSQNKKAEDKLNEVRAKGPNVVNDLQNEIRFLENEIQFISK
jgi:hypothetical protein